jgi:RNA polymerase sigma factor (sigma-70 family)
VGVDRGDETQATRELIGRCLAGDRDAIRQFQERYGELIYAYPMKLYRTAAESAGDFYVFAFENGRIFRRVRTYAGRAPFRAYLLAVVLDHLFIDWRRATHEIETLPLDNADAVPDEGATASDGDAIGAPADARHTVQALLADLDPPQAVVMKLLYIEDCELDAADLRHLTQVSGWTVPDVIAAVERLRTTVRAREVELQRVSDSLDTVQTWIELYERRQERLAEDLRELPADSVAAARARRAFAQLDVQLRRRQRQRAKLRAQRQRRKITAPYKDIAAILHTSVGNVASQIARLRQGLMRRARNLMNQEDEST